MKPGWVDGPTPVSLLEARSPLRSTLLRGVLLLLVPLLPLGCAAGEPKPPHRELAGVWRDYEALPAYRALAIAGQLHRQRWVAGISGGQTTRDRAEAAALEECRKRRLRQRMQAECRLYAVGDEVVWREP